MSEAVRLLWTHIIHKCSEVHSAMGDITGNKLNTSEQHVELGTSRIKRDNEDLTKILSWFTNFNPITSMDPNLRCLHSGLSSIVGKDNVNCEKIEIIGAAVQLKLDDQCFNNISFKRANCAITVDLQKSISIQDESIYIFNQQVCFQDC